MNPMTSSTAYWATTTTAVRSAAVEQVMRSCDDDLAVLPFLEVPQGSASAAAALGRLLSQHPQRLVAGCPLIALVTGAEVDPHWREAHPPRSSSLFADLEFLTSLYGDVAGADAYTSLEQLRARSEAELGGLDDLSALA